MRRGDPCLYDKPVGSGAFKGDQALHETAIVSRREFTHPGVPAVPNQFLEAGSTLLKELDAPSSVAEYANVQATLESKTKDKDAHKMEGGCLREFTRFLEKEVRAASPHSPRTRLSHESGASVSQHLAIMLALCQSQDPSHKWADLQRALLTEGQSVWCCKGCISIIKENTNATYKEIRVKVEAKAPPLPKLIGEPATPLQKAVARLEAAEAAAAAAKWWSCFKLW